MKEDEATVVCNSLRPDYVLGSCCAVKTSVCEVYWSVRLKMSDWKQTDQKCKLFSFY